MNQATPKDSKDITPQLSPNNFDVEGNLVPKPGRRVVGSDAMDPELRLEDLINNGLGMPIMLRKEAAKAGLDFYWTGVPCMRGHNSRRRTNSGLCQACGYIAHKSNNAETRAKQKAIRQEKLKQTAEQALSPVLTQTVLIKYSETGSLEKAAKAVGMTLAELNVKIARSASFHSAIHALEKRLNAQKEQEEEGFIIKDIVWSKKVYDHFIRAYVDTGDVAQARDAVGCSASDYYNELEKNTEFAQRVKEAKPKADQALEEKAINLALKGNDKLLTLVLKAKLPEYKEKIQIDQTNVSAVVHVDERQLNNRITNLLNKYRTIDGECVSAERLELERHEPEGSGTTLRITGRVGLAKDKEQV